jgi:hypothetical protein
MVYNITDWPALKTRLCARPFKYEARFEKNQEKREIGELHSFIISFLTIDWQRLRTTK